MVTRVPCLDWCCGGCFDADEEEAAGEGCADTAVHAEQAIVDLTDGAKMDEKLNFINNMLQEQDMNLSEEIKQQRREDQKLFQSKFLKKLTLGTTGFQQEIEEAVGKRKQVKTYNKLALLWA